VSPAQARARLRTGALTPIGFLTGASNHTLYCEVDGPDSGVAAVYKPRAGERPLWDFPDGTLCRREVAADALSRALGWDLVPPTVLRDGPLGEGSVQLFVPHDPQAHYFTLVEDDRWHAELARMALFDLLCNNTDRKGGHVLAADDGRLYAIDHGVTFHVDPKLRTVIWDLGGYALPRAWRDDVDRVADDLEGGGALAAELAGLLAPDEVAVLARRARRVAALRTLPDVPEERRSYPWPPI
jgi:Phosphatidylinositol 3- and 4-kinase